MCERERVRMREREGEREKERKMACTVAESGEPCLLPKTNS